jgi:hypothetical protein
MNSQRKQSNKVVYSKMMERDKDGNLITVLVAYEVVNGIRRRLSPSPKIEAPVKQKTAFKRKKK